MQKGLAVGILLLVALSIVGAVRATALADGPRRSAFEASQTFVHGADLADPGWTRRTLGIWLLAMTGTTVVLRTRSSRAIR